MDHLKETVPRKRRIILMDSRIFPSPWWWLQNVEPFFCHQLRRLFCIIKRRLPWSFIFWFHCAIVTANVSYLWKHVPNNRKCGRFGKCRSESSKPVQYFGGLLRIREFELTSNGFCWFFHNRPMMLRIIGHQYSPSFEVLWRSDQRTSPVRESPRNPVNQTIHERKSTPINIVLEERRFS